MDSCETKSCISCTVKNCVYHTENNACSAGQIHVGDGPADSAKETCCDTFKMK
ncbi:MAG: DUF1540 domain-containing protein [Acutalibacteraceae bacterium]|nr:DUF1540 domain-containing protein [Acutalibacteraceae bacterium]